MSDKDLNKLLGLEKQDPWKLNLYVVGEVNEGPCEDVIRTLVEADYKKVKEIHLHICSEGGYLSSCFAMIDIIEQKKAEHGFKVITHGFGEIASAGFFLFILGDERIKYPRCRVFVHEHITENPQSQTYTERLKADKGEEKAIYELYVKYTSDRLKIDRRKARTLLKKNKWLTSKEISRYGIITREKNE